MNELGLAFIFGAAAILHGITGMGFPMLGTTALAFMLPLSESVAMVALPSLLMSLLVLCSNNERPLLQELSHYTKHYLPLAISSIVGSIAGVWLLLILPSAWLYLLMAVVTLYYATNGLLSLTDKVGQLTVPTNTASMIIFGLLAGLVGGATNAMSPILLIFLFSLTSNKTQIAKASNLCYLLGKIVQIVMLSPQYATFDGQKYLLIAIITAISMASLYVGLYLRDKISVNVFKLLTFGILLLLALKIGNTGLTQLLG